MRTLGVNETSYSCVQDSFPLRTSSDAELQTLKRDVTNEDWSAVAQRACHVRAIRCDGDFRCALSALSGLPASPPVDICGSNPDIVSGHDSHDSCGSVWIVVDLRRRSWFPSCTTYIQAQEGENIT